MIVFDEVSKQYEVWVYDPKDSSRPPWLVISCPTLPATQAAYRLLFPKE